MNSINKKNTAIFLVLVISYITALPIFAQEHQCLLLVREATAFSELSKDALSIKLKPGIIIPILDQKNNGKVVQVSFYNKSYWVNRSNHRLGSSNLCSIYPKCFTLQQNAKIFEQPDVTAKVISQAQSKNEFDWLGQRTIVDPRTKLKSLWYQVTFADSYGWVLADKGDLDGNTCSGSVFSSQRKWFFNTDIAMESKIPSDVYADIVTSVPDPNFVTCMQDPIFTSIEKGTGQRIVVNTNYNMLSWLTLKLGLGFEQVKFKLNYLNNPHPNPGVVNCNTVTVGLKDLSSGEETITQNNVLLPMGAFYKLDLARNHSVLLGGNLEITANLPPGYKYIFYTGQTLSKGTKNEQILTPAQMRFSNDVELRYIYQMPFERREYLGFSLFGKYNLTGYYSYGLGIYF